jgi:hypothetical protein
MVFISSDGSVLKQLKGQSAWSRALKPPFEVGDIADADAARRAEILSVGHPRRVLAARAHLDRRSVGALPRQTRGGTLRADDVDPVVARGQWIRALERHRASLTGCIACSQAAPRSTMKTKKSPRCQEAEASE